MLVLTSMISWDDTTVMCWIVAAPRVTSTSLAGPLRCGVPGWRAP